MHHVNLFMFVYVCAFEWINKKNSMSDNMIRT